MSKIQKIKQQARRIKLKRGGGGGGERIIRIWPSYIIMLSEVICSQEGGTRKSFSAYNMKRQF